jgi:hypothetical protein
MHQLNEIGIKPTSHKRRTGLTPMAEDRLRHELRRRAPSEPWVDAQFYTTERQDDRGETVVSRAFDPTVFPPGGDKTLMVECKICNILTPPYAFESGQCIDHADGGNWGPSPSAVAIRALQWRNLRLTEMELAPESATALQKEMLEHEEKMRNSAKVKIESRPK